MTALLAAIAFDPAIRGILVVLVGVGVLGGSAYALVASNTGIRTGFMLTMAALLGWCFSMGVIWWIYGLGLVGVAPTWQVEEVNFDPAARDAEVLTFLPDPDTELPDAVEYFSAFEAENPEIRAELEATEGEGFMPGTLTEVVTLVPELEDDLNEQLGGWRILSESDSRRGEAIASADASLAANAVFGQNTSAGDYSTKDVFFFGGKAANEPRDGMPMLERAWQRVYSIFQPKNPELYAAVTLQKNLQQTVAPGEAPPTAQVDPDASTVTVLMLRNLGNVRLIPALFTIFTGIGFAVFCWMLHTRDKRAMATREAWDPASAA